MDTFGSIFSNVLQIASSESDKIWLTQNYPPKSPPPALGKLVLSEVIMKDVPESPTSSI